MFQSEMVIDRTAVRAQQDDEDALFDSWLASLSSREFEFILDGLADLELPTSQKVSA
jgi:hypothetical protein